MAALSSCKNRYTREKTAGLQNRPRTTVSCVRLCVVVGNSNRGTESRRISSKRGTVGVSENNRSRLAKRSDFFENQNRIGRPKASIRFEIPRNNVNLIKMWNGKNAEIVAGLRDRSGAGDRQRRGAYGRRSRLCSNRDYRKTLKRISRRPEDGRYR